MSTENLATKDRRVTEGAPLSGLDKASIFLLSLPDEHVTRILSRLEDYEVRELTAHMANLGHIDPKVVEKIFQDFSQGISTSGVLKGDIASTERILLKVFDRAKVNEILSEMKGPAGRTMWEKMGNISEDILAGYLKKEHPQTIAVVLSQIKPDHASRVLKLFEEEMTLDIIQRMIKMDSVQRDVINDIERTLRGEFILALSAGTGSDPYEKMAEIFNAFDRQTEEKMFTKLTETNPDSVEKIKSLMFTFEDIIKIDGAGIQTIIRGAEKNQLALALKGASDEMKNKFFSNMSERAAKLMKEDMESMGMVKLRDVDAAQSAITTYVKDLIDRAEVEVITDGDEEEMIG